MKFMWDTDYFLRPPFTVQIAKGEDIAKLEGRLTAKKREMEGEVRTLDMFEEYAKENARVD